MISGHGSSNPDVMFIGDSAHGEDSITQNALTGHQEIMLKEMCKDALIPWNNTYRTLFFKEKLEGLLAEKKIKKNKSVQAELAQLQNRYVPIISNEIKSLKPRVIIPLNEHIFHTLTGFHGIRKYRGSALHIKPEFEVNSIVLPILGPYPFLYSEYDLQFITRLDFTKINRYLHDRPILGEDKINVWVAKSANALRNYLNRSIVDSKFVTVDIETYYGIITCIGISFDGLEAVSVPIVDQSINRNDRAIMLEMLAKLMYHKIPKVNQNIKYDWTILERHGFILNNVVGDTQLAAQCLYCEFQKDLGFLNSLYTDLPYHKDEGKMFNPYEVKKDRLYLYNAKDALVTHRIYSQQVEEIKQKGVEYVYGEMIKCIPIYKSIDTRGIRVDMDARNKLTIKYQELLSKTLTQLRVNVGNDKFNPRSPQQCSELIFDQLGYKKVRGVKGTDEESLEMLKSFSSATKHHNESRATEILDGIINCRKINKVIEILELFLHPDNRFRCVYNLAGTVNGRTSASKTLDEIIYLDDKGRVKFEQLGHSLQTIGKHGFEVDGVTYGKDIRLMFVADEGYTLVEIDLSQAEARVDAVLAGNFKILEVFDGPIGIHRLTGSWVYNCDPSEIKKNILVDGEDRYHMSKTVRHAGERNMKGERLVMMVRCTLKRANEILAIFHKNQPEIREVFHYDVEQFVKNNRYLRAPNGRLREFFGRWDQNLINEAISYLPQAIVGDQMKFSLHNVQEKCNYAQFLSEAHDGVLAQVPNDKVNEYINVFKSMCERPIDFRTCSLPRDYQLIIPSEASIGECWYNLKDVK